MTGKDYELIAKAVNFTLEYWRKDGGAIGSPRDIITMSWY